MARLAIRHETLYRYTAPLHYTIQQLLLWPRSEPQQRILSWDIVTPGSRQRLVDAFGNVSHMLTLTGSHHGMRIVAHGIVEVDALDHGRLMAEDVISPLVFTMPTRLTASTPAVMDFATRHWKPSMRAHDFLALAEAVKDSVVYQSGTTNVTTTAADALGMGQGVCQDHAHLFLACCHAQGVPARYVSGYIDAGTVIHGASHAWVDVWVEESELSGWISIDVTHAKFIDTAYCRLAVGRDYEAVAPIRGVRRGGGTESMSVKVDVRSL